MKKRQPRGKTKPVPADIERTARKALGLVVDAFDSYEYWRGGQNVERLKFYCAESIKLVSDTFRFNEYLLKIALRELGAEDGLRHLDELLAFADRSKAGDNTSDARPLWDRFLKACGVLDGGNDFVTRVLKREAKPGGLQEKRTDRKHARAFFGASEEVAREIEYAILDWLPERGQSDAELPYKELGHLLWALGEMRFDFLPSMEASGPYVLRCGSGWGEGLNDKSLNGYYGILSVRRTRASDGSAETKCTFRCDVEGRVRTITWNSGRRFDRTTLFETWVRNSGICRDYPDPIREAVWLLVDKASLNLEAYQMLRDYVLPCLDQPSTYHDLVQRVQKILQIDNTEMWFDDMHLDWRTLVDLDALCNEARHEMFTLARLRPMSKQTTPQRSSAAKLEDQQFTRPPKPRLSATQELILITLGLATMTGEEIAKRARVSYNSNFKTALRALRLMHVLENSFPDGYYLRHEYRFLLSELDKGQGKRQD